MGYLIFQILFFLLVAALLGFVIGWLLRGARLQGELQDLDSRWRSKLSEVESERDRFVGELNQANETRANLESSMGEAQRLADTHGASLEQLRHEHQTKLGLLSDTEKKLGDLKSDLSKRDKELAEAKTSLDGQQGSGGGSERLERELAAARARTEGLERDLGEAKEANGACKREVERLEARITDLQRASAGSGGGALGLVGSTGSSTSGSAAGATGGAAGGGALGLVGNTDAAAGGQNEPGYRQKAASPSHLAEAGGQSFSDSQSAASGGSGEEAEGVRPEALSGARGGIADDLKKISGVGPKLEKTLNGLGIFHFAQIAAFTPDNVAWVDRHLRFKGRIEREQWIEQAKVLATGGDTEFSRRN